jgi:hypothetical protein
MHSILPRVDLYSHDGTGYANPHAVTSHGGTEFPTLPLTWRIKKGAANAAPREILKTNIELFNRAGDASLGTKAMPGGHLGVLFGLLESRLA